MILLAGSAHGQIARLWVRFLRNNAIDTGFTIKIMQKIILFIIITALIVSCKTHRTMDREVAPIETIRTYDIKDGCAVIKMGYYEASAEYIDFTKWENILQIPVFIKTDKKSSVYRNPKLEFFQITVRYIGDAVAKIKSAKIKYGNLAKEQMTKEEITGLCKSSSFNIFIFST